MAAHSYHHLYGRAWRKARLGWLASYPMCERCADRGIDTAANEIHHVVRHKGNTILFWDTCNWMSVCKACHIELGRDER